MYQRWEVHSKEFLKTIRPSNHIPNYFMECDKIKKGEETEEWCKTVPQRTVRMQMDFFFPPILLISLNFTTVQIKASPHANNPKQSSDF